MSSYAWCFLAAFDVIVVTVLYLFARSQPVMDRQGQIVTTIALSGFIYDVLLFREGAILYLQLATIFACIAIALGVWPFERRSTHGP